MHLALILVSSFHRLLFRYAAVILVGAVLYVLNLIATQFLAPWGVHGELLFTGVGMSLLLFTPIWHVISSYLVVKYHTRKVDILIALLIGVTLSLLYIQTMLANIVEAQDQLQWVIFIAISSSLIIGAWVATELLYKRFVHKYSHVFKHFLDKHKIN